MNQTTHYITEAVSEYVTGSNQTRLFNTISACNNVERANEVLYRLTGIRRFFPNYKAFEEFQHLLTLPVSTSSSQHEDRQWGDFQTPPGLVAQACHYLAESAVAPRIVIEPTYGAGNFILGVLKAFPTVELIYGVEIQEKYEWNLKIALLSEALRSQRITVDIELHRDNIFTHHFPRQITGAQNILIIGNPPWVTNAELGALNSQNFPKKSNIKALKGMDAMTGKSNFDIGEFVLLRILELFSAQRGTLAILCKNSVIKNIVEILPRQKFNVSNIRALEIDAAREFNAAVDASLLVLDMGVSKPTFTCQVATLERPNDTVRSFGWVRNKFVSDIDGYDSVCELDGKSSIVWRQGLKHDCAKIMELDVQDELWVNGNGDIVDIESDRVYWLLKSSDLRKFEASKARKKVIVTQHYLDENTSGLMKSSPKLWEYLVKNSKYFERRKSRIYHNKPRFSIFGVGEYSFKLYKVAISGLYKKPQFSLILPIDERPVMLDDTCYFLGFDTYVDALFVASLINSPMIKQFLQSIVFSDAKRPYTKKVLMRIDLPQLSSRISFDSLQAFWDEIGYEPRSSVTASEFEEFRQRLSILDRKQKGRQLRLDI
jgi:hypothetical protein